MKTTARGNQAETAVAEQLTRDGYQIIAQNWKTSRCEIDVVAKKKGIIYFVEVKYRGSSAQGNGLDYITAQKLRQLHFAAEIWKQRYNWDDDYRLMAAAVTGLGYENIELVEI